MHARRWVCLGLGLVAAATVVVLLLRLSRAGTDFGGLGADPDRVPGAADDHWGEAIVLVDPRSADVIDFVELVRPYLEHFGVPFRVLELPTLPAEPRFDRYSLIVLGHRGVTDALTDASRTRLTVAVESGTGLLSLSGDPWTAGADSQTAFAEDVSFASPASQRTIALAEAAAQPLPEWTPVAAAESAAGGWSRRQSPLIGTPTVIAEVDELARAGRPALRFSVDDVRPGLYDILAELYTGPPGTDLRYFFGFGDESPLARHVDAVGGSGGAREHTEYWLGRLAIEGGRFTLHVQQAEPLRGAPRHFGWSRVRLVAAATPGRPPHYIAGHHLAWERLPAATMRLVHVPVQGGDVVAFAGGTPFIAARRQGRGRVVVWGSTDWMRPAVRGPLGGLDGLLWRSMVWAGRKPMALQMLPPLLTMRVDDESGPLGWLHTAIAVGFKPWVGVFLSHMDDAESRELAAIVRRGDATASVHSYDGPTFFYFDHFGRRAWPTATMADNWRRAVDWHQRYDLPMSKYVVPHFYEIGRNALAPIVGFGAEFVTTHMAPGRPYGAPWLQLGPFRKTARGVSNMPQAVYYADFLPGSAGSPDARLFNCGTEIRDDAGYEWFPSPHVDVTVGRAVRQLARAFDSRALATLFTHGYFFPPIPPADWRTILERTLAGVAVFEPTQMTIDDACRVVRDQRTSHLSAVRVTAAGALHATLEGRALGPTTIAVFTESGETIAERTVAVPAFDGSVSVTVPPATLDPQHR